MISIAQLSYSINKQLIFKDLSFGIGAGENTGILGINGSGKTTLFRIILGIINDYSGEVRLQEEIKINYLPELIEKNLNIKVDEYLGIYARLYRVSRGKYNDKFLKLLDLFDLKKEFNKKLTNLSRGYKQRVNFCRTFLNDPELVLMDEPFSNIDPDKRGDIISCLTEFSETTTFLISSHFPHEISQLCPNIFEIRDFQLKKR